MGDADFFFQKYPFLYNQTGFSKTNNALQKRKKILSNTEILARKVDLGSFFFTSSEKLNKINFASQNLCDRNLFFFTRMYKRKQEI